MQLVLVSYVLRLVPEALAEGRLIGEVEAVGNGQHQAVRDLDELLRFCVATSFDDDPGPDSV